MLYFVAARLARGRPRLPRRGGRAGRGGTRRRRSRCWRRTRSPATSSATPCTAGSSPSTAPARTSKRRPGTPATRLLPVRLLDARPELLRPALDADLGLDRRWPPATTSGSAILLFRLVQAASALVAAVVVFLLLRHVDPERALVGAILVGWCPLVVVESGLSSHNDVLMGMLIVVGLVLAWQPPPDPLDRSVGRGRAGRAGQADGAGAAAAARDLPAALGRRGWRDRVLIFFGSAIVDCRAHGRDRLAGLGRPGDVRRPDARIGPGPVRQQPGRGGAWRASQVSGRDPDDLEVPLQFSGWWVGVHTDTSLFATARPAQDALAPLPVWSELLVVGPEREERLRVFDPVSRQVGYVAAAILGPIDPPAAPDGRPGDRGAQSRAGRLAGPHEANRQIRLVGLGRLRTGVPGGAGVRHRSPARLVVGLGRPLPGAGLRDADLVLAVVRALGAAAGRPGTRARVPPA